MSTTPQLFFGRENLPARPVLLRAGPLRAWFDPHTLFLRRICYEETEIVRGIYGAVRDPNWGTVSPEVRRCLIENQENAFLIDLDVECRVGKINYFWHGLIEGKENGSIQFRFEGVARSSFLANRIGLCVLHPIKGCAGQACRIEHVDGSIETGVFPVFISPHQPFKDIRSITHSVTEGVKSTVRMEGDTFEMEDQRNWTDASYKTYSRPLELPFPFRVEAGAPVQQLITLTLTGAIKSPTVSTTPALLTLNVPATPRKSRPPLGLCFSSSRPISDLGFKRLSALQLDHLRVDLHLVRDDWPHELEAALNLSGRLPSCKLHCALFLGDTPESQLDLFSQKFRTLTGECRPEKIVALWLIYPETGSVASYDTIRSGVKTLREMAPEIPIAAGTDANFAELNRSRPSAEVMPCFSCNPQVHTTDDLSLFENLEALPDTIATVRQFSSKPIVISPITLRPRFNAVATSPELERASGSSASQADPRQASLVGAAWTLGSLARLSPLEAIHSLTYFQIAGPLGIMADETATASAEAFPYPHSAVFPVYHLFAWFTGYPMIAPVMVSDPLRIAAVALFTAAGKIRVLIANLTSERQVIRIDASFGSGTWKVMDNESMIVATATPEEFQSREDQKITAESNCFRLTLAPYAVGLLGGEPT